MIFDPGFDINVDLDNLTFIYGDKGFGPKPEIRKLDEIRNSLKDKNADGPGMVYCIAMDVGNKEDYIEISKRNLLYGAVIYNKGNIGDEPIRSQGHIHAISKSCMSSTCEVYEIWIGEAIIYMQESGTDDAGRCYAIHGKAGDIIVVPPYWVHATINANPKEEMAFGAWCVKDYGFDYDDVRRHQGIAYYPRLEENKILWDKNENYKTSSFIEMNAIDYPMLNLERGKSIYKQFKENPDRFLFVSQPQQIEKDVWNNLHDRGR